MAALARKASLSDRSVQKIRNDVQGDWLTATYGNRSVQKIRNDVQGDWLTATYGKLETGPGGDD